MPTAQPATGQAKNSPAAKSRSQTPRRSRWPSTRAVRRIRSTIGPLERFYCQPREHGPHEWSGGAINGPVQSPLAARHRRCDSMSAQCPHSVRAAAVEIMALCARSYRDHLEFASSSKYSEGDEHSDARQGEEHHFVAGRSPSMIIPTALAASPSRELSQDAARHCATLRSAAQSVTRPMKRQSRRFRSIGHAAIRPVSQTRHSAVMIVSR